MEAIVEALEQLLPKGIVFDSPTIYAEVAKLPVVPLEDIHRHWKTYTRTHKSLHDPTACRLENFWWHVWGSDRRDLSGKTLARLWEQIASGPTCVPLRGPPNRWEPPPKPTQGMHGSGSTQPEQVQGMASQSRESQSSIARGAIYGLTPSSSRPPPAHTILKKPRGPSNSGPRPTARFVDVPDSGEEGSQQSGDSCVGTSRRRPEARAPSGSVSPAKVDRKPAPKKFVASSTTSKRRPVLSRRQSSQSSTGSVTASDPSPRDTASTSRNAPNQQASTTSAKDSSPSKRQIVSNAPTRMEEPAGRTKATGKRSQAAGPGKASTSGSSQDALSQDGSRKTASTNKPPPPHPSTSSQQKPTRAQGSSGEGPNSKVLGKRPEVPTTLASGRKNPTPKHNHSGSYNGSMGVQRSPPRSVPQSMQPATVSANSAETVEPSRSRSAQEDDPQSHEEQKGMTGSDAAPKMARLRSNNESTRMSSGGLKSSSVVGLSNIAVAGGFDFETPKPRPSADDLPPLPAGQPDIREASVLDSRLTPTEPSPNPPPPLGRSKSQLTLVLEREKARLGDGASKKKK